VGDFGRVISVVLLIAVSPGFAPFCHAQDAAADSAKAMLQKGVEQFATKDFPNAQATLLKVDRTSLSDADRKTLDEYLNKVRPAIQEQAAARSAYTAAQKALAANKLDEAEKGFAAAAASEYLDKATWESAREQLALVKERKQLAAAVAEPKPPTPPTPNASTAPAGQTDAQEMMARVKADRAKARQLIDAGRKAMDQRKFSEAAGRFREALELAPEEAEAQRLLKHALALGQESAAGQRLLTKYEKDRRIKWQAVEVDMAAPLRRAGEVLAKKEKTRADFENAEAAVSTAANILERNKSLPSAAVYRDKKQQIDDLRSRIRLAREQWVRSEEDKRRQEVAREVALRVERQRRDRLRKIGTLTEQASALVAEKRFAEGLEVVQHVLKLDPNHRWASEQKMLLTQLVSMRKERGVRTDMRDEQRRSMVDVRASEIPWYEILRYPTDWREITRRRIPFGVEMAGEAEADRIARKKLMTRVAGLDFVGTPFGEAIEFLRTVSGANIHVNWRALEDPGIDQTTEVKNVKLKDVTVEKALQVILEDVAPPTDELGFVVDQGVVTISTRTDLDRKTVTRVYDIRDLIVQIQDFKGPSINIGQTGTGGDNNESGGGGGGLFGDTDSDTGDNDNQGLSRQELIEQIIRMIQETIDPESWRGEGLPGDIGSIQELSGQLIITQTQRAHYAVSELISQLREAKALQINIEARFITVTTGFLSSIGLDLDVYLNTGSRLGGGWSTTDPYTGATVPGLGTSGWGATPPGTDLLTPIHLNQRTFTSFTDMLGQSSPINVGTSIGSNINVPSLSVQGVFLDDIQVNFLIEATQAHQESRSVMAPRLTLSNGQLAYVAITTEQFYVADLEPVAVENATIFNPVVASIPTGGVLEVRGTISADRRYVTLEVSPFISQLMGFTNYFVTVVSTDSNGDPSTGVGLIQLPQISMQRMQSTVSVPDGGTLLLGGMKASGHLEREKGVPLISKIPILNRLSTNRGRVRDDSTLLILIKPKIIIQREEEERWFPPGG